MTNTNVYTISHLTQAQGVGLGLSDSVQSHLHLPISAWASLPGGSVVKNLPANGDTSLFLGMGRSPGVGNGNPLQYSCLENSMDKGAWQAIVHSVTKSQA